MGKRLNQGRVLPVRTMALLIMVLSATLMVVGCQGMSPPATPSPDEVKDMARRAQAHYRAREWDQAIALFQEVVRYDPDTAEWWVELGWSLGAVGRQEEALDALRRAETLAPDNPWIPQGQARAYLALGRPADALVAAERALELDPKRVAVHRLRVKIYLEREQYDAAVAAALIGLQVNPDDPALLAGLAQGYEALGWTDMADAIRTR